VGRNTNWAHEIEIKKKNVSLMVWIHDAVWQRSHVVKARAQSVCAFVRPSVRLRLWSQCVCYRISHRLCKANVLWSVFNNYYIINTTQLLMRTTRLPSLLHIRTYILLLLLFWLLVLIVSNHHLYIIVLPHNFVF